MCILTWILLSLPPQTAPVAEGLRLIFSMFAPFLSVTVLFVLLDSWFGRTVLFLPCHPCLTIPAFRSFIYHDQVWLRVYFIPCGGLRKGTDARRI